MSKHHKYHLLLYVFVTLVGVSCPLEQDEGHTEYAILFDAGSSGTRMEIYHFLSSGPSLHPSEVLELDPSPHKVEPGLSTLADDPSQVEAYMTPLLESAKKTVPEDKQASTPIYLLATAGMRLLPEDQANAILTEVRNLFKDKNKCPFLFEDDNDARIITGQGEALFSWVTVNFLAEVFRYDHAPYGSLDLGGASTQQAWVVSENGSDIFVLNIARKTLYIYARTYLGYGQDQARESYLRFVTGKADCDGDSQCVVKSPCHNKGFKEPIPLDDREDIFEGTAKVKLCRDIIKEIFFCKLPNSQECPFHDQPKLRGDFYAFSAFYYVLTGIGTVCSDCDDINVTPRMIASSSKSFCKTDYDELKEDPFAKNNCFGGNYIYELLTAGYQLSPLKKVRVTNNIQGFDLGWTLGAVLYSTHILSQ